jgi:hypothetical protein
MVITHAFEQKEISLTDFLELAQTSILESSSNDG